MLVAAVALLVAQIPRYPGLKLVWHDEFSRDGAPDRRNWIYELGFERNKELQIYTKDNVTQKGGFLIIEGRKERVKNPAFDPKAPPEDWKHSREYAEYTSGSIKTATKRTWTYGRYECRGRFGITSGLWPAFWMTGPTREWPANGEVDIMEFYRRTYLANAAWGSATRHVGLWQSTKTPIEKLALLSGYPTPEAWAADFHVYRMDWTADAIRLFVDDHLLNDVPLAKTVNESPDHANPFREPHHLILNLAIGQAGGDPAGTNWPSRFEVDWVRVYQTR